MVTEIWVNIGSGNGLVPWRHQAITWTNADLSYVWSIDIHMRAVSQDKPQPLTAKISLKITHLKLTLNLPGANELTHQGLVRHIRVTEQGHHCFRWWFVACMVPSHSLNHCWIIIPCEKKKWNWNQHKSIKNLSSAKWHPFCLCLIVLSDNGRFLL